MEIAQNTFPWYFPYLVTLTLSPPAGQTRLRVWIYVIKRAHGQDLFLKAFCSVVPARLTSLSAAGFKRLSAMFDRIKRV